MSESIEVQSDEVFAPGNYECPTCGFQLTLNILCAQTGNIGVDRSTPDNCPNDGTEMIPLTWKRIADQNFEGAARARKEKDAAYKERDQLVAALSKIFPAGMERHPESDVSWDNDWRWIVFIDLPTGQATWHIHDSELEMFDHLPRITGRKWDGHTTEEKYERLSRLQRTARSGD